MNNTKNEIIILNVSDSKFNAGNNFNEEIQGLKNQYTTRMSEMLRAVKTAMAFAPRDLWKCDPSVHKLGKIFYK